MTRLFPVQNAVLQQETVWQTALASATQGQVAGVRGALRWKRQEAWDGVTEQRPAEHMPCLPISTSHLPLACVTS